jgi:drug/metabolite transporter (DMT)-like permease
VGDDQAPLAVVAALRETSILFGAVIAFVLLKEKLIALRIVAACGIAAGLSCCVCPDAEWQHLLPIIVYKTCLKFLSIIAI